MLATGGVRYYFECPLETLSRLTHLCEFCLFKYFMADDFDFFDDFPLPDADDAFDDFGMGSIVGDEFVETTKNVSARSIRLDLKRSFVRIKQKDNL